MAETKMRWCKVMTLSKSLLQGAVEKYNLPTQFRAPYSNRPLLCYIPGKHISVLGPWNNNPEWYIDANGNHWHESMFTIVKEDTDLCTCDMCIKTLRDMCKPLELTVITDDETISGEDY